MRGDLLNDLSQNDKGNYHSGGCFGGTGAGG